MREPGVLVVNGLRPAGGLRWVRVATLQAILDIQADSGLTLAALLFSFVLHPHSRSPSCRSLEGVPVRWDHPAVQVWVPAVVAGGVPLRLAHSLTVRILKIEQPILLHITQIMSGIDQLIRIHHQLFALADEPYSLG